MRRLLAPFASLLEAIMRLRVRTPIRRPRVERLEVGKAAWLTDLLWYGLVAAIAAYGAYRAVSFIASELGWADVLEVVGLGIVTLVRVTALILIASLIWVPLGALIGLRPALAERIQPLAQFLAAFPANLLFPIFVVAIVYFKANPDIWLSPLIILGTQWYILFNVIAGATAFPTDFRQQLSDRAGREDPLNPELASPKAWHNVPGASRPPAANAGWNPRSGHFRRLSLRRPQATSR